MLTKTAIVTATDGRIAQVTMVRPDACGHCGGGCHEKCHHTASVVDDAGLREGDTVELASSEGAFALSCAVMFLLPATLFVVLLSWRGVFAAVLAVVIYLLVMHRAVNGPLARMLAPKVSRIVSRLGESTPA